MKKWLVGLTGGVVIAMVMNTLRKRFMPGSGATKAEKQVLEDAGLSIEPGWFGQKVTTIDPPPVPPVTPPVSDSLTVAGSQAAEPEADIDPSDFPTTRDGHGAFGQWTLDSHKLPAYKYELNHLSNRLAYFTNSQGLDRRDHWHQIGNDHITGLAGNDGIVQVYLADRGGIFLNRYVPGTDRLPTLMGYFDLFAQYVYWLIGEFRAAYYRWRMRDKIVPRGEDNPFAKDEEKARQDQAEQAIQLANERRGQTDLDFKTELACAGGYSYLFHKERSETWGTALRYAPSGAETTRVFGSGYYENEIVHHHIRHTRRVYAPYGDDAVLLSDIELENKGQETVTVCCYEYWDVNIHQMRVQWLRSGAFAIRGDGERVRINSMFAPQFMPSPDGQVLKFRQQRFDDPRSADERSGFIDSTPPGVFLANLSGAAQPATDYFYDKHAFFGGGTAFTPDAVSQSLPGKTATPKPGDSMPYCLVLKHEITLTPGQPPVKLRFAYGALLQPDQDLSFLAAYNLDAGVDVLGNTLTAWRENLPFFSNGKSPMLQCEMTWHACNLLASTLYSEFYETHYIPQGSAYLYLHGADGVPRDQALFSLPMTYIRPDMARNLLILLMRMRNVERPGFIRSNALPYSFVGNGAQDDAHGLHSKPSDLDLFFLLAMGEYLAATGNIGFLKERFPLYQPGTPPAPGPEKTVLEHIEIAFRHLQSLGLGPHSLLTIGSGDWDDAIVATRSLRLEIQREASMARGESIPNSQMALYVLPLIASLIEPHHAALAADMRSMVEGLKTALEAQWIKEKGWFYRARLVKLNGADDKVGDNTLSLQSQIWALISGLAADMKIESSLIDTIAQQLDNDSPTGAMLEPKGQVWPAISQLLTWAYQRCNQPDLAWRSLNRHSFAAHATVFPSVWFNIWTGPDGTNSYKMSNPGGTWASPVTPMTDYPGMNANQNAMVLFGLLRCCGIEPSRTGSGLVIAPKSPLSRYVLWTKLLRLNVSPGRIRGEYHTANDGALTLHIHIPENATTVTAELNGEVAAGQPAAPGRVDLPLQFTKNQIIAFEVTWT